MTIRRKVIPLWSIAFALLVHLVPIFLAAAAALSMPARAIDPWPGARPPPYPRPQAGKVGRGDGAVADYRDGRDIRAFTPVFDGLLPGGDQMGTATSLAPVT